jgi:hypothetical protein
MLSKKLTPPTAGIDTLLWARRRFLATSLLPPEFSWFFLSSSFMVHPFLSIERRMSEGSYVKRQRSQLLVEDVTVTMRALVGLIPFVPLAPACSRDGDERFQGSRNKSQRSALSQMTVMPGAIIWATER